MMWSRNVIFIFALQLYLVVGLHWARLVSVTPVTTPPPPSTPRSESSSPVAKCQPQSSPSPNLGANIFDVTTIYEVGVDDTTPESSADILNAGIKGHVHSRTNALGMGLIDQNDTYADFEISEDLNLTCNAQHMDSHGSCGSWEVTGGIKSDPVIDAPGSRIKNGMAYSITPNLTLEFQDVKKITYLYFTNGPGNLQQINIAFLIKLYGIPDTEQNIFYNCVYHEDHSYVHGEFRRYEVPDRDGSTDGRIYCESHYGGIPLNLNHDFLTFSFTKKESKQNVKIYRGENRHLIINWDFGESSDDENVNFFSVSPIHVNDYNSTTMVHKVIEADEMTSTVFTPQSHELCLAMWFHSSTTSSQPQLEVHALSLTTNSRSLLQKISSVEEGWNIKVVNATLESLDPLKLSIKRVGSSRIGFARIASCSSDGEDVFETSVSSGTSVRPSSPWETTKALFPVYTALPDTMDPARELGQVNNTCLHGGVSTTAGCACSPGFTGSRCEIGCGGNRFGQDCEGLCSIRHACRGLLMCTKFTGCRCAPGYSGDDCTQACAPGWYGNDCSERCGHCAGNSACDIYTGECTACDLGYIAPRCKQVSVYYGSKPEVSSPSYDTIIVSFDPTNYITVDNPPQLYQIQYKEKGGQWLVYANKLIQKSVDESENENKIIEQIDGLKGGTVYQVRVLLMNSYFNKYDGDLIQVAEITTKCDIPTSYDYKLAATSNTTSIDFSWRYLIEDNHWCPVELFEVRWKEGWKWEVKSTNESKFTVIGLLPGVKVEFKTRAVTKGGPAPYSRTILAYTHQTELSPVRNLRMESSQSTSVKISWDPPRGMRDNPLRYTISYKCVDRPACSPGCQDVIEGSLTQEGEGITLSPLLPLTQYLVTVRVEGGVASSIYIGTTDVVPTEVPLISAQRPVRSNTSVTVFWDQPTVCTGYLLGYNYQLTKASDYVNILANGFTKETNASFSNLTASTEYTVRVYVSTAAGWNPLSYLAINISTSATVPETVRNLTVYKRSRGMLGLRWAEPRAIYGHLKSFTVTYSLGQEVTSHTVEPSHCVVWPDLYCHTIEGLRSNRRYNITVSARNADVSEDGKESSVSAITKESSPTAPVNLKLINSTSTSIVLQWGHPDMANGILRSFLVSIEETEKFDQDSCCQVYPLVETSVKDEAPMYETEVSGLHPASTYYVSVSAKTVGMGPSQTLVAYTRPPHHFTMLPRLQVPEVTWLPQEKLPEVNNSETYKSLVRAHLLLAVLNETQPIQVAPASGIMDPKLDSILQQEIGNPFYFIAEYNQDDEVQVSGLLEDSDSPWGRPLASLLPGDRYQLVASQILEYNGVYNVDLRFSKQFTLP